jgi:molybdopterin-guanine dinucleotide biosynthesis protein A
MLDAVILAGEKEGAIPVLGKNKALIPFRGRPLIGWVIQALNEAQTIASITVVGPQEKLAAELSGLALNKPLAFLEQGQNIFENIWRGALSTFPEYRPGITAKELSASPSADKAVAVLTCDMPLLEAVEVDHFIRAAPLDRADIVLGVTREEMLLPFRRQGPDPGISFICACLRDRVIRHSNIFCYRPLKLAYIMETYIPIIYRLRYQRRLRNIIAAAEEVIRYGLSPSGQALFFLTEAASWCHNHGWTRLRQVFRRPLSLEWVEKTASKVFRTPFAFHETIGPGPTLDVDDEESLQVFSAMADRWKAIQLEQIRKSLENVVASSA